MTVLIYCASLNTSISAENPVFALFGLTMRRQIEHMRRYKSVGCPHAITLIARRYVPWVRSVCTPHRAHVPQDLGKRTFGGKR